MTVLRGRLLPGSSAPGHGERAEALARPGGVLVAQVVSGQLGAPVDYDQDHDEWAVVLSGAAVLEVAGERVDLAGGDWVLLPAHVPHRLVEVRPGTSWLTVHAPAGEGPQ